MDFMWGARLPSSRRDPFGHRLIVAAMALLLAVPMFAITAVVAPQRALGFGAPTKLAITVQPGGTYSADDETISITVEVQDVDGSRVEDSTASIDLALGGGTTSDFEGTHPKVAVAGEATFDDLAVRSVGTGYQFTATSAGLTSAMTTAFAITPGAVAAVLFTDDPDGSYSADALNISAEVTLQDAHGNDATNATDPVTVTLVNPNGATLEGTTSQTPSNGVASFTDLEVHKTGTGYALEAHFDSLDSEASSDFAITPGDFGNFVFDAIAEQQAGVAFDVEITAYDSHGNVKTDYNGTAALTGLADGPGCTACDPDIPVTPTVPGSAVFASGQATKSVTAYAADDTSTITATDATEEATGTSDPFVVTDSGVLGDFVIDSVGAQVAGVTFSVTATVYDSFGNVMESYAGTPVLTGLDPAPGCGTCDPVIVVTNALPGTVAVDDGIVTVSAVMAKKVLPAETVTLTDGPVNATSTGFTVTPGALGDFTLAALLPVGTKTAGGPIPVTATVYDVFGNLKTNYAGTTIVSGNLGTAPGLNAGTGDDSPASYVAFAGSGWSTGTQTTTVTAFLVETGRTITVSDGSLPDGTRSATSPPFSVGPNTPFDLKFAVAHLGFNGQPIDTKTNTSILSVCVPSGGTAPCATSPTSTGVKVLVRDLYGNAVANTTSVSLGIAPLATGLGPNVNTFNGIADFGNGRIINALGSRNLTARATTGSNPTDTSASFLLVNDLRACDDQRCENKMDNPQQKSFNLITTGNDFFTGPTNVILRSQFLGTGEFTGTSKCGIINPNNFLGQGAEAVPQGAGVTGTAPETNMLIVIRKDTLKEKTSRNATSYNVCIGATPLPGTTPPAWTTKTGPATLVSGVYWGVAADCSTFAANTTKSLRRPEDEAG